LVGPATRISGACLRRLPKGRPDVQDSHRRRAIPRASWVRGPAPYLMGKAHVGFSGTIEELNAQPEIRARYLEV
jgi:hypothetical protein